MTSQPTTPPLKSSPELLWPVLGALCGAFLGLADVLFFRAFDIDMMLNGRDVTLWVGGFFSLNFAGLGFFVVWLWQARAILRAQNRVIAEQLRALEDSRQQRLQSEKLAAIGRLAAGIAHEVRNPLGVIRSSASLLEVPEGAGEDNEVAKIQRFIVEEVDRLNSFVTALLQYSKPIPLNKSATDVLDLAHKAKDILELEWVESGLDWDFSACESRTVAADADLIVQVLLSLIRNSLEVLPKNGRVSVRSGEDSAYVWLEVADNGPGLTEEAQQRAFDPFFTTKDTGTGLGLAMALRILESHCGQLSIRTGAGGGRNGRGACFRVALPRSEGL